MITLKDQHALIVGAGQGLKKHWDKIEGFINANDVTVIGCNNVSDFLVPDIHFWGSVKRFKRFGHLMSKKSKAVFQWNFPKKVIKKYWKGDYEYFYTEPRLWKFGSDDKDSYLYKRCCMREKKGVMYGCFCAAASKAIFWSYLRGAKRITLAGTDGYTFFSKKDLLNGEGSQNCYGKGFTNGFNYEYNRKIDWDTIKTFRLLAKYGKKKHGFVFEIITPTVYEEFYNPEILNIPEDPRRQKWVEPTPDEYHKLYFESKENRTLEGEQYSRYNG